MNVCCDYRVIWA